jgi:hypothetical protein
MKMSSLAAFCGLFTFAMSMMVMAGQPRVWAAAVPRQLH